MGNLFSFFFLHTHLSLTLPYVFLFFLLTHLSLELPFLWSLASFSAHYRCLSLHLPLLPHLLLSSLQTDASLSTFVPPPRELLHADRCELEHLHAFTGECSSKCDRRELEHLQHYAAPR